MIPIEDDNTIIMVSLKIRPTLDKGMTTLNMVDLTRILLILSSMTSLEVGEDQVDLGKQVNMKVLFG